MAELSGTLHGSDEPTISVLLVEDDEEDTLLVRALLEDAQGSFDVMHVSRLSDAEEALIESSYDCALVDLSLPDARQLDAVERLRARAPGLAIVILTGFNDEQLGVRALHKGAQDYLVKGRVDGEGLGRSIRYALERRRARARLMRSAERTRTVTLLFTNIVGSTELLGELGDEAAEQVRRTHFRVLRDAVAARSGDEVKSLGDGLMVAFPSALDAVGCAVEMQRRVDGHNRERPDRHLQVRVGLNVGEPICREDDYFGTSVVVAKRLCDAAGGGQILISDLVRSLISSRGSHELRSRGSLELKGLTDPISAHEVVWETDESHVPFPMPAALDAARRSAFVGRGTELGHLDELWSTIRRGERRIVFVAGEPGIGKTRLAGEFARTVHDKGGIVLYGRSEEDALVPYQPFVEALSQYLAASSQTALRDITKGGERLKLLLPELADRIPDPSEPARREDRTERYRLFGAVASLVEAASEGSPVLLVLEDLHWADEPTLLLLKHIARHLTLSRLMVLATYRESERARGDSLSKTLVELRRERLFDRLEIHGLGEEEVAAMARSWAGQEVGRKFASSLRRQTAGNPFFIEEILRRVGDSRPVGPDRRWSADLVIEHVGIPESVRDAVARHISRLSAPTNHLLRIASVIGPEFDLDVLSGVNELPEDRLLDALEEGVLAGLLEEIPGNGARYSFSHALVRETLYAELREVERSRLHGAIGETMERFYDRLPEHYHELANHFAKATRAESDKALRYAMLAGHQAMEVFAYEQAAGLFELALQIDDSLAFDAERRANLMLALGEARTRGDDPAARDTLVAAAEAARAVGLAEQLAHAALGIHVMNESPGMPDDRAIELLEEALEGIGSEHPALRARLLVRLAVALYYQLGTADRRAELVDEAVDTARRLGDSETLCFVLGNAQLATWGPDATERDLGWVNEVLELVEPTDAFALHSRMRQVDYLLELDDLGRAEIALQELEGIAAKTPDPRARAYVPLQLARRASIEGRYAEVERLNTEAANAAAELGDGMLDLLAAGQLAMLRWTEGRIAETEDVIRRFAVCGSAMAAWPAGLAVVECELGREEEAREVLESLAQDEFRSLPRYNGWLLALALLSDACARLDEPDHARELYRLLLPFARRNVIVPYTIFAGPVSLYLGMLAATCREWDDASRHFESASEAISRQKARPFSALLWLDEARMLAARDHPGDRVRSVELASKAADLARELGSETMAERANELARATA